MTTPTKHSNRKIIQLIATPGYSKIMAMALCDDGTVWGWEIDGSWSPISISNMGTDNLDSRCKPGHVKGDKP